MEPSKTTTSPNVQNSDKSAPTKPTAEGAELRSTNPADALISDFHAGKRERVPMSVPQQKLAVPDIPGYHCHWMADRVGRLIQAMNAGYEFVRPEEVYINNIGLANDISQSGSTDLGTRISVVGGAGEAGQVLRLYLMKIRQEWWEEDQAKLMVRNSSIMDTIKRTGVREGPDGAKVESEHTYVRAKIERSTRAAIVTQEK